MYLYRAVDRDGQTLDFMLSERRDTAATLAGIEAAHMIRKGQVGQNGMSPFKQIAALAG